jgi:hypothetical protein
MSQGFPAEIVSFERFVERRQRLADIVPMHRTVMMPTSTDPANSARLEREPRTTRTAAIACQPPDQTTT